jgi:AcrR family transcriptional regulator
MVTGSGMGGKRVLPPRIASTDPSADARERLLSTAYELFRCNGVGVVGVDRIAAEAGVSKTSLYRLFGSKEGLVLAVFELHEELWTFDWLEREIELRGDTAEARLLAIFDALHDWFQETSYEGCFFTNALLEVHDRSSQIRLQGVARLGTVHGLVRRLAEAARVRDPELLADQLQILMWGSIVAALDGRLESARRARALAQLLLEQERLPT